MRVGSGTSTPARFSSALTALVWYATGQMPPIRLLSSAARWCAMRAQYEGAVEAAANDFLRSLLPRVTLMRSFFAERSLAGP